MPINGNVPTRDIEIDGEPYLWGRGTVDMKAGVAVQLKLAAELADPRVDITWMWYDHEEVDADLNGLTRLARTRPDLFAADFAILGEPSNGAGRGRLQRQPARDRAHPRRPRAQRTRVGRRERDPQGRAGARAPRRVRAARRSTSTGSSTARGSTPCASAAASRATSSPTSARSRSTTASHRAATPPRPSSTCATSSTGFDVDVVDLAVGARPGLDAPLAQEFLAAVGAEPRPKYGWTDVARFTAFGVPAVNYGPGDPQLAHHDEERVPLAQIDAVEQGLRAWLTSR